MTSLSDTEPTSSVPFTVSESAFKSPDGINLAYTKYCSSLQSSSSPHKVVCFHGWLDNAATFNKLAPALLTKSNVEIYCVDFPGHGKSSHKSMDSPSLMADYIYYAVEFISFVQNGNQTKLIIIGHSMGSGVASIVASVYPDLISRLVMLEGVGPLSRPASDILQTLRKSTDKRQSGNRFLTNPNGKGPRVYESLEAAVQQRCRTAELSPGTQTLSYDAALAMVSRATIPSGTSGGVSFIHDPRLAWPSVMYLTTEMIETLIANIKVPTLIIGGDNGWPIPADDRARRLKVFTEDRGEGDGTFQHEVVEGSHHLHLDEGKGLEDCKRFVVEFLEAGWFENEVYKSKM